MLTKNDVYNFPRKNVKEKLLDFLVIKTRRKWKVLTCAVTLMGSKDIEKTKFCDRQFPA